MFNPHPNAEIYFASDTQREISHTPNIAFAESMHCNGHLISPNVWNSQQPSYEQILRCILRKIEIVCLSKIEIAF